MFAEKCFPSARQAKGTLELRAAREHGDVRVKRERDGRRGKAAAAAQDDAPARRHAHDRVVHAVRDFAVMREDRIGDVHELPFCRRVLVEDRLTAEVRARHDPEIAGREEQKVHGRVGEHNAEVRVARRDGGRGGIRRVVSPP